MKLLIVGDSFARDNSMARPLEGRAGRRIASLAGVTFDEYPERSARINVVPVASDWSSSLSVDEGRRTVRTIARDAELVVVLGVRAARALGVRTPLFTWSPWYWWEPAHIARAPHPSGLNRWWNDPEHVQQARAFWRPLLELAR